MAVEMRAPELCVGVKCGCIYGAGTERRESNETALSPVPVF